MSEVDTKLAAGEEAIKFCCYCGAEFAELLTLNIIHSCPDEGGCGMKFQIFRRK